VAKGKKTFEEDDDDAVDEKEGEEGKDCLLTIQWFWYFVFFRNALSLVVTAALSGKKHDGDVSSVHGQVQESSR